MSYERVLDPAAALVKRTGLYALALSFLFMCVPVFMILVLLFIAIAFCVLIAKGVLS